jgi:hypothetical protein
MKDPNPEDDGVDPPTRYVLVGFLTLATIAGIFTVIGILGRCEAVNHVLAVPASAPAPAPHAAPPPVPCPEVDAGDDDASLRMFIGQ